ncbi:hypothetical protein ACA910_019157 [Epithemia clementina (nom. ined.)]
MIEQGTDGLLHGDLMNGVLTGCDMLQYVPLNKSCKERQPGLVNQFLVVTRKHYAFIPLTPTDWFEKALTQGDFVWTPPPAAADAAVEKLCKSKHIRPLPAHIFICPALMTSHWRKKLGRIADVVFAIPVGTTYWTTERHKPLIDAFVLPFFKHRPWQFKRDGKRVAEFTDSMQEMWTSHPSIMWECVRKLWSYARDNQALPGGMA